MSTVFCNGTKPARDNTIDSTVTDAGAFALSNDKERAPKDCAGCSEVDGMESWQPHVIRAEIINIAVIFMYASQ
jgi:hypothetical protein